MKIIYKKKNYHIRLISLNLKKQVGICNYSDQNKSLKYIVINYNSIN